MLNYALVCYIPWSSPYLGLRRTMAFSKPLSATYLGLLHNLVCYVPWLYSIPWSATYIFLLHTMVCYIPWPSPYLMVCWVPGAAPDLGLLHTSVSKVPGYTPYLCLLCCRYLDLLPTRACSVPGPALYLGLLRTWALFRPFAGASLANMSCFFSSLLT